MQSSFRGVDREEEDRYRQIEFNRNPRLHSHTAAEKLRSDRIGMKATGLRDVSLKAKVVNKIVRDASGIHTYTLVPPPRAIGEVIEMDADPETNARVKSYTKETKKKPLVTSYGHRPRSASKIFNPGTMRIHMKHNEIAKAPQSDVFEFGLPAGILNKVLRAPALRKDKDNDDADQNQKSSTHISEQSRLIENEGDDLHSFMSSGKVS